MTRYSSSGTTGLIYGNYGVGVYGSGDIPDLRLNSFVVRPTDGSGSYVDASGNPIFGRGTAFWQFKAAITPKVKLLRSTKGYATDHLDTFSTVIAATDYPINLAGATVDQYGWTVVATKEPHYLKVGDVAAFSNVPVPTQDSTGAALSGWNGSPLIDGSWYVSTVLSPIAFAVRQNAKPLAVGTKAMIASPYPVGLTMPFTIPNTFGYSPDGGHISTPSLTRLALDQTWATDTATVPGVEYYYTLWVNDPTVPGLWALGGEALFLAPKDHGSIARFIHVLPPYLTNVNYGTADLPLIDMLPDTDVLTPGDPSMLKFLAGLAWGWDQTLTQVDKVRRLWNASTMPAALLPSAIATFGLPDEPTFGMRSRRALVEQAQFLNSARGTDNGLTAFVEALTGLSSDVSFGKNLMLSTNCSSFYLGTGSWYASNATFTTDVAKVVANPASTYYVTAAPTTPPGLMTAQALKATQSATGSVVVSLLGGIANATLTATGSYLRVDTSRTHGLEVGDYVQITGAASGFNITGRVATVPTATRYTLTMTRSATLPTGSTTVAGYTQADPTTSGRVPNPYAVMQGVPVTPGTAYRVSYNVALGSGTGTTTAAVTWWDVQGRPLTSTSAVSSTATGTTMTQYVSGALTAPSNAAFMGLDITLAGGSAGTVYYLDAVQANVDAGAPDAAVFEDARTVFISLTAPTASAVADQNSPSRTVVKSRLLDNLQNQLPVGVAFRLSINGQPL